MPPTCAVADCTTDRNNKSIIYHSFPNKNKSIRKIWITKCKRKDKINPSSARICSVHFNDEDYERDLRNELLGLPPRKRLKSDAIPCVFVNRKQSTVVCSARTKRTDAKNRKRLVSEILSHYEQKEKCSEEIQTSNVVIAKELESEIDYLNHVTSDQKRQIIKLKKKLHWQSVTIDKLKTIQKRNIRKPKKHKTSSIFSKTQRKKLKGQVRVNWTTSDIVKALSVRSVSLKAYDTAREKWGLPLPCPRTLRRWTYKFNCSPGIQKDILAILKCNAGNMEAKNKLCILSFDEMAVSSRVVHDRTFDSISSNSKAQVVMLRGLCEKWKQPIFFDFDRSMDGTLLKEIIKDVNNTGLKVVAVVCDLGGENRSLWNSLGITCDKVSFKSPTNPDDNIYVFADVPHLIKLLRNHLVDDGVYLEDGTIINKSTLEKMLLNDSGELKLCPKLSNYHINVKGAERMKVRPAVQIFSRHVSTLAKKIWSDKPQIGDFFLKINDAFDVLNSRCYTDKRNLLKSRFELNNKGQLKVLSEVESLIKSMKFMRKSTKRVFGPPNLEDVTKPLLPCQKGFLTTITSLKMLMTELKEKYNIGYCLTSRLNQDCLESFFSRIRAFGGNSPSPTTPEFRYRFRLIVLGSQIRPPKGTNTEYDDEVSYISSELLSRNKIPLNIETSESVISVMNTSNSATCHVNPVINVDETENEALTYLAGYIAWKLKKKHLGLFGQPTSAEVLHVDSADTSFDFLNMLSRGGLLIPNPLLLETVRKCESWFSILYEELKSLNNISTRLYQRILGIDSAINTDIVKEYINIRLKIKVRMLNRAKENIPNNRKNIQFHKSRKS